VFKIKLNMHIKHSSDTELIVDFNNSASFKNNE